MHARVFTAKWSRRQEVKSGVAVLSLGGRGREKRETTSDLGVAGMEKGRVEAVVREHGLEGRVRVESVGRTFQTKGLVPRPRYHQRGESRTGGVRAQSPAQLPAGDGTHRNEGSLLLSGRLLCFLEACVPAGVGSHHPAPADSLQETVSRLARLWLFGRSQESGLLWEVFGVYNVMSNSFFFVFF